MKLINNNNNNNYNYKKNQIIKKQKTNPYPYKIKKLLNKKIKVKKAQNLILNSLFSQMIVPYQLQLQKKFLF